jgi:hypothetical protein
MAERLAALWSANDTRGFTLAMFGQDGIFAPYFRAIESEVDQISDMADDELSKNI